MYVGSLGRGRGAGLVLLVAGFFVIFGALATADPYPASLLPDDNPHGFCFGEGVGDDPKPNIREAEWDALGQPTDANVTFDSTCDLASGTETDVVWRVGELPDGVLGRTNCEDVDEFAICDQFYIRMDMQEIEIGERDELQETEVACHELGHTVSLEHGPEKDDCMDDDLGPAGRPDLQWRRYSPHHKGHINERF